MPAAGFIRRLIASREAVNTALAAAAALVLMLTATPLVRAQEDAGIERYDREMLTSLIETVIAADQGELIMTSAIPAQDAPAQAGGGVESILPGARPEPAATSPAMDRGALLEEMPDMPRAAGFAVQLGSFSSAANAQAGFEAANARYAGALGAHTLYVQPVDLGERGVFHRLRIGGYDSIAGAIEGCKALGIDIADCIVVSADN